ncbi:MAG: SDR family oxidoreductase [Deltaproteobacteria bacterium]|nr:SDR family oxidoreductase [Deltaproteobacteria bacterium]
MEYHDRKRILVTGGAGFLGSHLCDRLVAQKNDILCLDNFFTGTKGNISHLLDKSNFELIRHDLVQPLFLEVDEIYNLACPASPVHYQHNPVKTVKTSVMGAVHMLGLAKRVNAKILQASTSEVYGDPAVHPQKENYWGNVNTIGPRSCYDEGKRCAETLFFDYYRQNNVNIVSNFFVQALNNEDITVFGDGSQTRSFCYVDDLIEGILRMMNGQDDFPGPVNLGNPGEFTILELAEKIIDLTGSKSKIVFKPLPEDDPMQRQPDINLAEEKLGWKPVINLEQGLKKTVKYFESLVSGKKPVGG